MKKLILVFLTVFLLQTVSASDLSDYPTMLLRGSKVVFVIGDNADIADAIGAVDVATSLQFYSSKKLESSATLASEITNLKSANLVVVGGPCANPIAAQLFGYPKDCMKGFTKGKGIIRLFSNDGTNAIVVAGATATDTRRTCRVLANFNDYKEQFNGTEIEVSGTSLTDVEVAKVG